MRQHGWPNARRCLAGDGNQHTDIDGIPSVSIEVKDRTSSSWPAWRLQAITQAHPGDIVIVIRRTRGVTDVGQWEAQMPLRDWYWITDPHDRTFPDTVDCSRTSEEWARLTVANIVQLLQDTHR
jgi:hypothetical protein